MVGVSFSASDPFKYTMGLHLMKSEEFCVPFDRSIEIRDGDANVIDIEIERSGVGLLAEG